MQESTPHLLSDYTRAFHRTIMWSKVKVGRSTYRVLSRGRTSSCLKRIQDNRQRKTV